MRAKRAFSSNIDPYVDGLQAIGNAQLLKKLPGEKQTKLFSSVIARDPW